MRILQATSEFHPYSKTGGLADMVAGLSGALVEQGHEITVATPLYLGIGDELKDLKPHGPKFQIILGKNYFFGRWWKTKANSGVTVLFLENKKFFDRAGLYMENGNGYWDNPERFMFLSKAVAELSADFDVVHVHDWQTAFVPMLLKLGSRKKNPGTMFTIHNLAYQGMCEGRRFEISNLPNKYFKKEGPEFWGSLNFLKAGLHYAGAITTVSPQYAKEILTPEFGEGMDGVLLSRENDLTGVLNGVDYGEWRTMGNPNLPADYSSEDLSGKKVCKKAVMDELGLECSHLPLFGIVSRFAEQKGIGLLADTIESFLDAKQLQLVVLGEGDPELVNRLIQIHNSYPSSASVQVGYNAGLAHRIEAGSDFFLMPSRFEPCGLNQMYSLRYGSIPVAHAVGGLVDTVRDKLSKLGPANGIIFNHFTKEAFRAAISSTIDIYHDQEKLENMIRAGMRDDYSWHKSAQIYGEIAANVQSRQRI